MTTNDQNYMVFETIGGTIYPIGIPTTKDKAVAFVESAVDEVYHVAYLWYLSPESGYFK